MELFWLKTIKSSVLAQSDLFKLFSDYLTDHLVIILAVLAAIIVVTLLLSKKMTASNSTKYSYKSPTKQGQYKKFK